MTIKEKLDIINYNIEKSVEKSGRDISEITVLPVSKRKTPDEIRSALALGFDKIGENYVQELLPKYDELKNEVKEFHFIGHLQSNKVKYIIDKVSLIHSVDSLTLLKEINKRAGGIGKIQDVLLEVNYVGEQSKTGADKNCALEMLEHAHEFENVRIKGLMTMPPAYYDEDEVRKVFTSFREFYEKLGARDFGSNVKFSVLSMGMSGDYPIAVENGATIVRIGTALFGKRD